MPVFQELIHDVQGQAINVCSMFLLLSSFAIVAQRSLASCVSLYAMQSFFLGFTAMVVANASGVHHLYFAAALNFLIKAWLIPRILHRAVDRLNVKREVEPLVNIPSSLLICGGLMILALYLSQPIKQIGPLLTNDSLALGLAIVFIGCFIMISRRKLVTQIVGFLTVENGLFLLATAITYGMPLIVELGVFFDILVAALIFGVLLHRIQDTFESARPTKSSSEETGEAAS